MTVHAVTTRRAIRRFVALPYRLHRDVPQWVPPLRRDVIRLFDRRHPYYRHSEAAFFVAEHDGDIAARVGVHENTLFNEARGRRWAFFHLFEAVDHAAGREVLAAAAAWARARGLQHLVGPMGFLPGDGMGVLVDGFDHRASMTVAWNPPSYAQMLEAHGFVKETDFTSGVVTAPDDLPAAVDRMVTAALAANDTKVRPAGSKRRLKALAPELGEAYNRGFADNWEYRPVIAEEAGEVAARAMPIVDPRLILLVERAGDLVGFFFALPDAAEGLQRARGRLFPLGWYHILSAARRATSTELIAMALAPEHRGTRVNLAVYARVLQLAQETGIRSAELVQVEEGNARVRRNLDGFVPHWTKRHRVYGLAL